MIVELNENAKISAAIALAEEHNFLEALRLFAQVDSYESLLNQIYCLCEMEDMQYAVDLYRYTKQRFCDHAVYADILGFEDVTETLLEFCEPNRRYAAKHDGKIRADKGLLIDPEAYFEPDESPMPDLNYYADAQYIDDPDYGKQSMFFDVKSERYFEYLRVQLEKAIVDGDSEKMEKYQKMLLDVETTHLPTLEAQIALILYREDFEHGMPYVKRLVSVEGGSHAAVGGAIDIVMRDGPQKHLDELKILMHKAMDVIDEVTLYDLEDYIYISTSYLYDLEMAYKFADMLFADYDHTSLECLKACACAFFNYGDYEKARKAALCLRNAVPYDIYAQLLLDYIKHTPYSKNQAPLEIAPRMLRHFAMPTKMVVYANKQLCKHLQSNFMDIMLTSHELFYLSAVIFHCKTLILTDRRKEYYELAAFLRAVIFAFQPENKEEFVKFAKENLFTVMSDQSITESLIAKLLVMGYDGKAYVGLTQSYYVLDFAKVPQVDELFVDAFAICASLVEIKNPKRYVESYLDLTEGSEINTTDPTIAHQIAYAMLCDCVVKFADSPEVEFFVESEFEFYKKYLEQKQLEK